jgi:hypothetical protein
VNPAAAPARLPRSLREPETPPVDTACSDQGNSMECERRASQHSFVVQRVAECKC